MTFPFFVDKRAPTDVVTRITQDPANVIVEDVYETLRSLLKSVLSRPGQERD